MKEIGLIEFKIISPVSIIRKRGKGGFYETCEYLPGPSIIGALSRKALLENVSKRIGNCSTLTNPNQLPNCRVCYARECFYKKLWIEKQMRISPALIWDNASLTSPPPIYGLSTIFSSVEDENIMADGLLLMSFKRLAINNKKFRKVLLREFKIVEDGREYEAKKRSANVAVGLNTLKKITIDFTEHTHVAIDDVTKSSIKGLLYKRSSIKPGHTMYSYVLSEGPLLDQLKKFEGILTIGGGRSRGYGIVNMRLVERKSLSNYMEERRNKILEGFRSIKNRIGEYYDEYLGTVTGISHLDISNTTDVDEALAKRLENRKEDIVRVEGKIGNYVRIVKRSEDEKGHLFIIPVIQMGYCATFVIKGDIEEEARRLAEIEVKTDGLDFWNGWIYLNHPVHHINLI